MLLNIFGNLRLAVHIKVTFIRIQRLLIGAYIQNLYFRVQNYKAIAEKFENAPSTKALVLRYYPAYKHPRL